MLSFLRVVSSGVAEAGHETIGGVATARYDGTLDLAKVAEEAPAERRAELREELDFLKDELPTTVPYSVWVDGRDVARRLRFDESGPEGRGATVTIDFFDFGVPVVVNVPSEDEVTSDDELFRLVEAYWKDHPGAGCGPDSKETESSAEGKTVFVLCDVAVSIPSK